MGYSHSLSPEYYVPLSRSAVEAEADKLMASREWLRLQNLAAVDEMPGAAEAILAGDYCELGRLIVEDLRGQARAQVEG